MIRFRTYGIHVKAYAKMKTESRWWTAYTNNSRAPVMLIHQKAVGTTTRLLFSVAYHCTKNREKNTRLPHQPTTFQKLHSMPRNWSLCQSRFEIQSIR
jgi:hypothetical protein